MDAKQTRMWAWDAVRKLDNERTDGCRSSFYELISDARMLAAFVIGETTPVDIAREVSDLPSPLRSTAALSPSEKQ